MSVVCVIMIESLQRAHNYHNKAKKNIITKFCNPLITIIPLHLGPMEITLKQ